MGDLPGGSWGAETIGRRCRGKSRAMPRRARAAYAEKMSAELAIRGGTVVDGTGSPPVRADVGVSDGRIVEIAPRVEGTREIDASGRLVTPGFIDIHTHYDPQVLWDSSLSPSCWHGVTSVVAGNCGYSIAPTRPENRDSL